MPIALVTGSGVRVGRAIANVLLEAGYDLLLHAHRSTHEAAELVKAAAAKGRVALVLEADLSSVAGALHLADLVRQKTPALDLLVNSAGLYGAVPLAELDEATYRTMQAVNLEAPLFLTRALLPELRAAEAPSVVNITDAHTARPYGRYAHYFISKAGLEMLTRVLAIELAPKIRVNAVAPGAVALPEGTSEAMRASIVKQVPLGREGSPEDVAHAVLFLARDGAYVTGQILKVDGGAA
jgi:pteridine reductase